VDDHAPAQADQQSRQRHLPHRDRPQPATRMHDLRADLAACMLTLLDDPATVHRRISIAN
jgi:hypothetical protein